jgi:hypothetical protein
MVAEKIKAKLETFQPSIQGYAVEWQKTVQGRIHTDSQMTRRRRFEHEHYRRKTAQLRRKVRHAASRGTPVPTRVQEKLVRNERKLQTSTDAYHQAHANMRMILDEATRQYWRDLYPLIWHCTVLDSKLVHVEMETLQRYLPTIQEALTAVAHEYRIPTDEHRLAEWAHSNPAILCTNNSSSEEPFQPPLPNRFPEQSHRIHRIEEEEEEEGITTAVPVGTPSPEDEEETSKLKDPNDPNQLRDDEILVSPMPTHCLQKIPRTPTTTTTPSHGTPTTNIHRSNIRNNTILTDSQNRYIQQQQQQHSYTPRFKDQAQTVIWNEEDQNEATPIMALPVATPLPMEHEHSRTNHTQR